VKLHDLHPAPGSRKARRRVGRGIAAGQGKTAGRGTKGAKARAGGKIPAWFEGGQTPLHQRLPKLRGFKNLFKVEYEVVNLGDIARLVELGELEAGDMPGAKPSKKGATAPITVNQEILRAAGLVRRLDRPMKVLGGSGSSGGAELTTALFVVADAFSASARAKIEKAGGTVSVLEVPDAKRAALGIELEESMPAPVEAMAEPADVEAVSAAADDSPTTAEAADAAPEAPAKPAKPAKAAAKSTKAKAAATDDAGEAPAPRATKPAARKPKTPKPDADA
jgi:large subunit ribosomal protein L15